MGKKNTSISFRNYKNTIYIDAKMCDKSIVSLRVVFASTDHSFKGDYDD